MASKESPRFPITVDVNVLEHLGINSYGRQSCCRSDGSVANAWDADASTDAMEKFSPLVLVPGGVLQLCGAHAERVASC